MYGGWEIKEVNRKLYKADERTQTAQQSGFK